jgi:hypothetical protein
MFITTWQRPLSVAVPLFLFLLACNVLVFIVWVIYIAFLRRKASKKSVALYAIRCAQRFYLRGYLLFSFGMLCILFIPVFIWGTATSILSFSCCSIIMFLWIPLAQEIPLSLAIFTFQTFEAAKHDEKKLTELVSRQLAVSASVLMLGFLTLQMPLLLVPYLFDNPASFMGGALLAIAYHSYFIRSSASTWESSVQMARRCQPLTTPSSAPPSLWKAQQLQAKTANKLAGLSTEYLTLACLYLTVTSILIPRESDWLTWSLLALGVAWFAQLLYSFVQILQPMLCYWNDTYYRDFTLASYIPVQVHVCLRVAIVPSLICLSWMVLLVLAPDTNVLSHYLSASLIILCGFAAWLSGFGMGAISPTILSWFTNLLLSSKVRQLPRWLFLCNVSLVSLATGMCILPLPAALLVCYGLNLYSFSHSLWMLATVYVALLPTLLREAQTQTLLRLLEDAPVSSQDFALSTSSLEETLARVLPLVATVYKTPGIRVAGSTVTAHLLAMLGWLTCAATHQLVASHPQLGLSWENVTDLGTIQGVSILLGLGLPTYFYWLHTLTYQGASALLLHTFGAGLDGWSPHSPFWIWSMRELGLITARVHATISSELYIPLLVITAVPGLFLVSLGPNAALGYLLGVSGQVLFVRLWTELQRVAWVDISALLNFHRAELRRIAYELGIRNRENEKLLLGPAAEEVWMHSAIDPFTSIVLVQLALPLFFVGSFLQATPLSSLFFIAILVMPAFITFLIERNVMHRNRPFPLLSEMEVIGDLDILQDDMDQGNSSIVKGTEP